MPARHIPTHAFDEILTELGDDPAIPDPHGVRKSSPSKYAGLGSNPPKHSHHQSLDPPVSPYENLSKKIVPRLPLAMSVVGLVMAAFAAYQALNPDPAGRLDNVVEQISELKKQISALQKELDENQAELYEELGLLEVSIHSLKENKAPTKTLLRPASISHESELRRWQYLGAVQMGGSHQAFFLTEKGRSRFEKGMVVLGDWRLSQLEKELATINHPNGKSITLKTIKGE